jgi:hypothetical protein
MSTVNLALLLYKNKKFALFGEICQCGMNGCPSAVRQISATGTSRRDKNKVGYTRGLHEVPETKLSFVRGRMQKVPGKEKDKGHGHTLA